MAQEVASQWGGAWGPSTRYDEVRPSGGWIQVHSVAALGARDIWFGLSRADHQAAVCPYPARRSKAGDAVSKPARQDSAVS